MVVGVPALGQATYAAVKNGSWAGQGLLCPARNYVIVSTLLHAEIHIHQRSAYWSA
jgi:hypothetical protein